MTTNPIDSHTLYWLQDRLENADGPDEASWLHALLTRCEEPGAPVYRLLARIRASLLGNMGMTLRTLREEYEDGPGIDESEMLWRCWTLDLALSMTEFFIESDEYSDVVIRETARYWAQAMHEHAVEEAIRAKSLMGVN